MCGDDVCAQAFLAAERELAITIGVAWASCLGSPVVVAQSVTVEFAFDLLFEEFGETLGYHFVELLLRSRDIENSEKVNVDHAFL